MPVCAVDLAKDVSDEGAIDIAFGEALQGSRRGAPFREGDFDWPVVVVLASRDGGRHLEQQRDRADEPGDTAVNASGFHEVPRS